MLGYGFCVCALQEIQMEAVNRLFLLQPQKFSRLLCFNSLDRDLEICMGVTIGIIYFFYRIPYENLKIIPKITARVYPKSMH
jgi:hypothetical protein